MPGAHLNDRCQAVMKYLEDHGIEAKRIRLSQAELRNRSGVETSPAERFTTLVWKLHAQRICRRVFRAFCASEAQQQTTPVSGQPTSSSTSEHPPTATELTKHRKLTTLSNRRITTLANKLVITR